MSAAQRKRPTALLTIVPKNSAEIPRKSSRKPEAPASRFNEHGVRLTSETPSMISQEYMELVDHLQALERYAEMVVSKARKHLRTRYGNFDAMEDGELFFYPHSGSVRSKTDAQ